jgi:hypothetical protein
MIDTPSQRIASWAGNESSVSVNNASFCGAPDSEPPRAQTLSTQDVSEVHGLAVRDEAPSRCNLGFGRRRAFRW